MSDLVKLKIENHIATVTLNRANKKNALSREMFDAISQVGEELKKNQLVRVIILTGAGSDFCSGPPATMDFGKRSRHLNTVPDPPWASR